jgi:hypothetical protein
MARSAVDMKMIAHRVANGVILSVLIAGGILFLVDLWKVLYLSGKFPGIYWLFVYFDEWISLSLFGITLIKYAGLAVIALLFSWILVKWILKKDMIQPLMLSGAQMVFTACFSGTLLLGFAQDTVHLQRMRVRGNVYYLAAYPMFDINYRLYKCEPTGTI